MGGGGGVASHPLQLTTGLVVNSFIITNPTLVGERMLLIPKVSILSEQMGISLRSSSNGEGPSRVWMALLEQQSPSSPVFHNLRNDSHNYHQNIYILDRN